MTDKYYYLCNMLEPVLIPCDFGAQQDVYLGYAQDKLQVQLNDYGMTGAYIVHLSYFDWSLSPDGSLMATGPSRYITVGLAVNVTGCDKLAPIFIANRTMPDYGSYLNLLICYLNTGIINHLIRQYRIGSQKLSDLTGLDPIYRVEFDSKSSVDTRFVRYTGNIRYSGSRYNVRSFRTPKSAENGNRRAD